MKKLMKEENIEGEIGRFPFKEDDIRYYRIKETKKRESNAVVICIMDTSGSMDQTRKYLASGCFDSLGVVDDVRLCWSLNT